MSSNLNDEIFITEKSITYKDYRKFVMYHHRKLLTIFFMLFFLIFFILVVPYSVQDLLLQFIYGRYDMMVLILFLDVMKAAIISGLFISLPIFFILLRVRQEYKSDRLTKADFSYTINKEGINQEIRRSNTFIEWEYIYKVYEKKDMFIVYISRNKAFIFPKRNFNSEDEITTFKNLVRKRLAAKKIKMK